VADEELDPYGRTLSVIVPVFDERNTVVEALRRMRRVELPVDLEIVVVDDGSTDGTSQILAAVEDSTVLVVRHPKNLGKGAAIRTGLQHVRGDLVLIQDADLEYDLDDYERLLEPLRTYRHALVLGSRHGANASSWQLRQFAEQPAVSRIMNVAHVGFTWFFDTVYGTRLRDPFTMFKVFRRECLSGLTFESNRFDFDWELLAKLVRAGYTPVEIPVRYRSRSYREGKKIRFWRDPLTWVRACLKYRFVRLEK
jgi:glycosyltransferase involved in cell wall biosynthesis